MITFPVSLGVAHYTNGFINITTNFEGLFPTNGMHIIVYLGGWGLNPIIAKINRTAQPNGTPRIMLGIKYTNWVQANYARGAVINLTFQIFPTCLLIN